MKECGFVCTLLFYVLICYNYFNKLEFYMLRGEAYMNKEWSERNKKMQSLLKKSTFADGIQELIDLRNILMQEINSWKELPKEYFFANPFINADGYHSKTIAYSLWHIFRIEDIVVHSLIQKDEEILLADSFHKKMNTSIITTGNELSGTEISDFSKALDIDVLYQYIQKVKSSTDKWLTTIDYDMLKTKFNEDDKSYINGLNVVSNDEKAIWLIDYWCNKDIKGLLKMPLSRHWIMHIEGSLRIIKKLK